MRTRQCASGRFEHVAGAHGAGDEHLRRDRQLAAALAVDRLQHAGVAADPAGLGTGDHDAAGDAAADGERRPPSRTSRPPARPPLRRPGRRWTGTGAGPRCRASRWRSGRPARRRRRGRPRSRPSSRASRGGSPRSCRPAPRTGPLGGRGGRPAARPAGRASRRATASSAVTVPSGSTTSTPPSGAQAARGEQQLGHPARGEAEAGVEVEERPLPVALDAFTAELRDVQPLALQRLHRVAPELQRPACQRAGVQARVQVPDHSPPGSRTTRSRRRPARSAGRSSARPRGCAGAGPRGTGRRCRSAATARLVDRELQLPGRTAQPHAGPSRRRPARGRSAGCRRRGAPIRPTSPWNGAAPPSAGRRRSPAPSGPPTVARPRRCRRPRSAPTCR